jgi:hypothetical protein
MLPIYHSRRNKQNEVFYFDQEQINLNAGAEDGCFVYGLYFDGAKWSSSRNVTISHYYL